MAEFRNCRWLDYCLKLDSYDEDIAQEFAQTFSEGKIVVKGLEVIVTEERIVEVMGLLVDGEPYPTTKDLRSAKAEFIEPSDLPLVVDKHGTKRNSLPKPWRQVPVHIVKYITCDGL